MPVPTVPTGVKFPGSSPVELLGPGELVKTCALDQAEWNSSGLLGAVQRHRFKMAAGLLAGERYGRLLEVGYGSGIFMPTLARFATELFGVDVHDRSDDVEGVLARRSIAAHLSRGDVCDLDFPSAGFDAIVAVSALEFVADMDAAAGELARVLKPGGTLVVITPGHSRLLDTGLKVLTGERAEDTFCGRRQLVVPALSRHLDLRARRPFPPLTPAVTRLYTGLAFTAR